MQLPVGSFGVPPGDQLPLSHGLGCFELVSNSLQQEHRQVSRSLAEAEPQAVNATLCSNT
jgi:hypothetical protein